LTRKPQHPSFQWGGQGSKNPTLPTNAPDAITGSTFLEAALAAVGSVRGQVDPGILDQ
jgi:hypothetical protein